MNLLKYKNKLVILVVTILLSSQEILSENNPPAPQGTGGFDETGGVVGSPIDDLLPLFIIIALLYGLSMKLKNNRVLD